MHVSTENTYYVRSSQFYTNKIVLMTVYENYRRFREYRIFKIEPVRKTGEGRMKKQKFSVPLLRCRCVTM